MKDDKLYFSSDGYDFLETYTKALYGTRGTFRHNLERYLTGEEFCSACREPRSIDDIPELSFPDILRQIEREEYFKKLCANVLDIYTRGQQNGTLKQEDDYELAGIMGLCPGHCDWHETLFPHLVDLFVNSEEEGQDLLRSIEAQPNIVSTMVSVMSSGLRQGQIINYFGRNMWSQGYARNYFRGENAYNVHTRPSLFRDMPTDADERELYRIIGYLRIVEFSLWLCELPFVRDWPFGDVFHGAIAQHYGIPTNGIDITSDLKTALFFACCCYDDGQWRPLSPHEYEDTNSRVGVAKRGGDSRFGILFCAPADVANMSRMAGLPNLRVTGVTPIGFQPFIRCSNQSGYMIEAGEPYDLYLDRSFSKFKFRHTPEICQWIFEEMEGGRRVYPKEMFGTCEDIVATIKESNQFTEQAFTIVVSHLGLQGREKEIRSKLAVNGYSICSAVEICSEERKSELTKKYFEAYSQHEYSRAPAFTQIRFLI